MIRFATWSSIGSPRKTIRPEQPRVDVERAPSAGAALDDHGDEHVVTPRWLRLRIRRGRDGPIDEAVDECTVPSVAQVRPTAARGEVLPKPRLVRVQRELPFDLGVDVGVRRVDPSCSAIADSTSSVFTRRLAGSRSSVELARSAADERDTDPSRSSLARVPAARRA